MTLAISFNKNWMNQLLWHWHNIPHRINLCIVTLNEIIKIFCCVIFWHAQQRRLYTLRRGQDIAQSDSDSFFSVVLVVIVIVWAISLTTSFWWFDHWALTYTEKPKKKKKTTMWRLDKPAICTPLTHLLQKGFFLFFSVEVAGINEKPWILLFSGKFLVHKISNLGFWEDRFRWKRFIERTKIPS
jgi:hypothetical protein